MQWWDLSWWRRKIQICFKWVKRYISCGLEPHPKDFLYLLFSSNSTLFFFHFVARLEVLLPHGTVEKAQRGWLCTLTQEMLFYLLCCRGGAFWSRWEVDRRGPARCRWHAVSVMHRHVLCGLCWFILADQLLYLLLWASVHPLSFLSLAALLYGVGGIFCQIHSCTLFFLPPASSSGGQRDSWDREISGNCSTSGKNTSISRCADLRKILLFVVDSSSIFFRWADASCRRAEEAPRYCMAPLIKWRAGFSSLAALLRGFHCVYFMFLECFWHWSDGTVDTLSI